MCQRYLIFTAQQVYWECRQAAFCEAIKEPVEAFADMNKLPSFALSAWQFVHGTSIIRRDLLQTREWLLHKTSDLRKRRAESGLGSFETIGDFI